MTADDSAHIELSRRFLRIGIRAEVSCGREGAHRQVVAVAEDRRDLVRKSATEIRVSVVDAERGEWEHGDRSCSRHRARAFSRLTDPPSAAGEEECGRDRSSHEECTAPVQAR
jgi:hypothetical protein